MGRGRAAITRCGVRRHNFVTLGGAVRAAANFATLEASVHGAASEEEKKKAEQQNHVISKLYNFGGLMLDLLPQGVSKGGASTGLNFATLGRACLGAEL